MRGIRQGQGFTLIEILIVLTLLAIFSAIAIPGFNRLIDSNRTRSAADELRGLLQYARGYAVENRTNAWVCMQDGELSVRTNCAGGGQTLRVMGGQGVSIRAEVDDYQFHSNGASSGIANYIVCANEHPETGFTVGIQRSGQVQLYPRGQKEGGVAMNECAFQ